MGNVSLLKVYFFVALLESVSNEMSADVTFAFRTDLDQVFHSFNGVGDVDLSPRQFASLVEDDVSENGDLGVLKKGGVVGKHALPLLSQGIYFPHQVIVVVFKNRFLGVLKYLT